MRLVGGAIVIALESHPSNIGLIVAALVLLNVGVIPLIVSNQGLLRIMYVPPFSMLSGVQSKGWRTDSCTKYDGQFQ